MRSSRRRAPGTAAPGRWRTRRSAGGSSTPACRRPTLPSRSGETAERVADQWHVSRERQDAFALESQRRAAAAQRRRAGSTASWCRSRSPGHKGAVDGRRPRRASPPRHQRRGASRGSSPPSRPAARSPRATAPASTTAPSALLLVEAARARELGLRAQGPRRRRRPSPASTPTSWASAPSRPSARPSPAPGINAADLDVVELNEAYASQSVACMRRAGARPGARQPQRRRDRAGSPAGGLRRTPRHLPGPRAGAAPAAATASRRCASGWGRGSPRSSSASTA